MNANYTDCSETDPGCLAARKRAILDGVSHPGNLPFMLVPHSTRTAALLVHGFTASPWEMRLLAERLAIGGCAVLAVRLPGHGTTTEDLARRRWQEWFAEVEQGYRILAGQFASVFAIGMSTGCLLSLALAETTPLHGLVLFSPYLRLRHRLARHAGWLKHLRPHHTPARQQSSESPYYYSRRPVAGVHQINRLIRQIEPRLPACTAPVLAFNAEKDQTVVAESGQKLVAALGSRIKIHQSIGPAAPHILTREENPGRDALFTLTLQFIREMAVLFTPDASGSGTGLRSPAAPAPRVRNCR